MSRMIRDKNKSIHKLEGFGPVYCINLDDHVERWEYMQDQFDYWNIKDYTRISGYDGREDDLSDIITGRYPDNMLTGEVGCTTSHLKAMKEFLKETNKKFEMLSNPLSKQPTVAIRRVA